MFVYGATILHVDEEARFDCMVDLGFRCFSQVRFVFAGLVLVCPEKARRRLDELLALSAKEGILIESTGEGHRGLWAGIFRIQLPNGSIMDLNQQLVEEGFATLIEE